MLTTLPAVVPEPMSAVPARIAGGASVASAASDTVTGVAVVVLRRVSLSRSVLRPKLRPRGSVEESATGP